MNIYINTYRLRIITFLSHWRKLKYWSPNWRVSYHEHHRHQRLQTLQSWYTLPQHWLGSQLEDLSSVRIWTWFDQLQFQTPSQITSHHSVPSAQLPMKTWYMPSFPVNTTMMLVTGSSAMFRNASQTYLAQLYWGLNLLTCLKRKNSVWPTSLPPSWCQSGKRECQSLEYLLSKLEPHWKQNASF